MQGWWALLFENKVGWGPFILLPSTSTCLITQPWLALASTRLGEVDRGSGRSATPIFHGFVLRCLIIKCDATSHSHRLESWDAQSTMIDPTSVLGGRGAHIAAWKRLTVQWGEGGREVLKGPCPIHQKALFEERQICVRKIKK
jgi:hypothetical protein